MAIFGFLVLLLCLLTDYAVADKTTVTAALGESVHLPCGNQVPKSSPHRLGVSWSFVDHNTSLTDDLLVLADKDKRKYSVNVSASGQYFLVINNVSAADQGHYRCDDSILSGPFYVVLDVQGVTDMPPTTLERTNHTGCCVAHGVSDSCLPACSKQGVDLDTFNFLANCATDLVPLVKCFSGGQGHVPCCRQRLLPEECFDFCLSSIPTNLDPMRHLPCLLKSSEIIQCYQQGSTNIPSAPRHLLLTVSGPQKISVAWLAPTKNAENVQGYRLHWRKENANKFQSVTLKPNELSYHIEPLIADTRYEVFVTAYSVAGLSKPSEVAAIRTDSSFQSPVDYSSIMECCRGKMTSSCVNFFCSANSNPASDPLALASCLPKIGDALACYPGGRNLTGCCEDVGVSPTCTPLCGGAPLSANSAECFRFLTPVRNCLLHGWTLIPSTPKEFSLLFATPTSASLQWKPPANAALVQQYVLHLKQLQPVGPARKITVPANKTNVVVNSLVPEARYEVSVTATNSHGSSLPSATLRFFAGTAVAATTPVPTSPSLPPGAQEEFNKCCREAAIPNQCMFLCDFEINLPEMLVKNASILTACGIYAKYSMSCGADGRNHTNCCVRRGVSATCLDVCYLRGPDDTGLHHLACLQDAADIFQCYKEGYVTLPRPPTGTLTYDRISDSSVRLTWGPSPTSGVYYIVSYMEAGRKTTIQRKHSSQTTLLLSALRSGVTYEVSVAAGNKYGESVSLPHLLVNTHGSVPTTTPIPSHIELRNCCMAEKIPTNCLWLCDWDVDISSKILTNASLVTACGNYADNALACGADGRNHTPCCVERQVPNSCLDMCGIRTPEDTGLHHLQCLTSFNDILQCYKEGYSKLPRAVTNIEYLKVSSTSVHVSWKGSTGPGPITYIVMWSTSRASYQLETSETGILLQNLAPSISYEVRVVAKNQHGTSVASPPLLFSTSKGEVTTESPQSTQACCRKAGVTTACMSLCDPSIVTAPKNLSESCFSSSLTAVSQCVGVGRDHSKCCALYEMPSACFHYCMGSPTPTTKAVQAALPSPTPHAVCEAVYAAEIWTCRAQGNSILPSRPWNLREVSHTTQTMTIEWRRPTANYDAVDYRVVYWIPSNNEPTLHYRDLVRGVNWSPTNYTHLDVTIRGLVPGGEYSVYVLAKNTFGVSLPSNRIVVRTDSDSTALQVSVVQVPSGIVNKGDGVTLSCTSNTAVSYSWSHASGRVISTQRELRLPDVGAYQEGLYTCRANSSVASLTSSLLLRVRYSPVVNLPRSKVMVVPGLGKNARLVCVVQGFPTVTHWQKPDGKQVQGERVHIVSEMSAGLNLTKSLVIEAAETTDLGTYVCVAKNAFGEAKSSVELVGPATLPPGATTSLPPPGPHVGNATKCCIDNQVSSVCMPTCNWAVDPEIITSPSVRENCLAELPKLIPCVADGRDHSQCCKNKKVNEDCLIFCEGRTPDQFETKHLSCISLTNVILTCMKENNKIIPTPPRSIEVRNSFVPGKSSVTVNWYEPNLNSAHVTHYNISLRELPRGTSRQFRTSATFYRFDDLIENVAYEVIVVAVNFFGSSDKSTARHFTAPARSPEVETPSPPAKKSNAAAIGVGVAVSLLVILAAAGLTFYWYRTRRSSHERLQEERVQYNAPQYQPSDIHEGFSASAAAMEAPEAQYVDAAGIDVRVASYDNTTYTSADLEAPGAKPASSSA